MMIVISFWKAKSKRLEIQKMPQIKKKTIFEFCLLFWKAILIQSLPFYKKTEIHFSHFKKV